MREPMLSATILSDYLCVYRLTQKSIAVSLTAEVLANIFALDYEII